MIIRISKVEIAGPKGLLLETLELLRESRAFQVEAPPALAEQTEIGPLRAR